MSTATARWPETRTCVFWDVKDYPIPEGLDPASVYRNMESAFRKEGYEGDLVIVAYRWNKPMPDSLLDEYRNAGIIFAPQGDEHDKVFTIFVDMLFWSLDNIPSNMILLLKSFPGTLQMYLWPLEDWYIAGYHVLLSEPCSPYFATYESSLWIYESLYGGKPMDQSGSSKKQRIN